VVCISYPSLTNPINGGPFSRLEFQIHLGYRSVELSRHVSPAAVQSFCEHITISVVVDQDVAESPFNAQQGRYNVDWRLYNIPAGKEEKKW
jgi:hypothetical protein